MKSLILFFTLFYISSNAQVSFDSGTTLLDLTHCSIDVTSVYASDLNNDGFKELIVASYDDNTIMFYKNTNGDIQHHQRKIIYVNDEANFTSHYTVIANDLDNDGLNDIIAVSGFEDKLFWFKNLGDHNFSPAIIITTSIDNPRAIACADIDQDGDNDIVVGLRNGNNVSLFANNGDGTFSSQQIIHTTYYGVNYLMLKDLDNDGFLDIISGDNAGVIYWAKHLSGITFSDPTQITGAAGDGVGFDFIDINNDSYLDIVFCSNYSDNLRYILNESGETFSTDATTIDNSITDPNQVRISDFDGDNIADIIVSTLPGNKIGWYKNNGGGSFDDLAIITTNISNPKDFIVEDLNNNGIPEIITSSQSNSIALYKLASFEKNESTDSYQEKIINFHFGAATTMRVADINNDGYNDVVSATRSIVWNENLGSNNFSSQKLISSSVANLIIRDFELKDLNNDGFLDIVVTTTSALEVYKNNGDESFSLEFSLPFSNPAEIEVFDINNDGKPDILITFLSGSTRLAKLINNDAFSFQAMEGIDFSNYGYQPSMIRCGDIDNDGDIDIVVSSGEYSRIQLLKNNGAGTFTYQLVASEIDAAISALADVDNDGDLDILTAGNSNYSNQGLWLIKNNGATFGVPFLIDIQTCKSITLGDINNDGFVDLVGTSYEYFSPYDEKIFCYLNNGGTFGNKTIIESLGDAISGIKDAVIADLDNDNKMDIISSSLYNAVIRYFLNTSELSTIGFESKTDHFYVYPNPSTELISWNTELAIDRVAVYDLTGKILIDEAVAGTTLKVNHLNSGIYFVVGISNNFKYSSKLIIK